MSGLRPLPTGAAGKQPARNDPCPCGSGLKYKQCCAIRPPTAKSAAPARVALGTLTAQGREVTAEAAVGRAMRGAERSSVLVTQPSAPTHRSPEVLRCLREAKELRDAGRMADTIPLLRQAARLDPADARIHHELGVALLNTGRAAEAVVSLRHAIRLDPKFARSFYRLGLAMSRMGRVVPAIAAHRSAIALAPKLAEAHMQLGDLLQAQRRTEEAAKTFETAAAVLAGTTRGRLAGARALIARDRRDEAMTLLRHAAALDPKSVEPLRGLGNTLAEAGHFQEAEQQFMRALALDPRSAADCYQLAILRKLTPADRPLVERMTGLLQAGGLVDQDRMLLHFGLGKAHDDLHEFEAAIGHFDAGNRIRSDPAPLNRKGFARFVDRMIELFPRDALADDAGVDDERPVFILGMPRSGTTLAEQILSSHPAVAAGGEMGFWGLHADPALAVNAGPLTRERLHALAAGYQAVLHGVSAEASRVTDKNPFNFSYIGLLRLAFPRAFIIHCRRHPVDTCLSIYTTSFAARDLAFMGNREDLVFYYQEYTRLMRHWREALPPGRFLEIDYEKLVADSEAETRRLIAFCGLDWHDACLRPEGNRRTVTTASRWQARQPVYRSSLERWRNYEPWLGPFAGLLPPEARTE